jgi:1-deoxy-D-xylulose-5-phosphate reductoisomerase
VQFEDGAVKAQLGVPDMKLPIQYAFSFPQRLAMQDNRLDLFKLQSLHFYPADMHRFPCLDFSYKAIAQGGNMSCIMNAANEVVNLAFRRGEIAFPRIAEIISETMQRATFSNSAELEIYFDSDREARRIATELVNK